MEYKNKTTKDLNVEECKEVFINTAETITACGEDIRKATETLMLYCQIPGTKGEMYKDMLFSKIEDMKRLYVLFNRASRRFLDSAEELKEGKIKEKIINGLLVYGIFFIDQLESEEEGAIRLLKILREDHRNSLN